MTGLVLRADGGAGVGMGHLARCFALAEAWRAGGPVGLRTERPLPSPWADRFAEAGVRVTDPGGDHSEAAWGVIDGYRFRRSDVDALRETSSRVLAVTDHGLGPWRAADLVVDHNAGATAEAYRPRSALVGPRYALLRAGVRAARAARGPRVEPQRATRLAVALGGAPDQPTRELAAAIAARAAARGWEVDVLDGTRDLDTVVQDADVVVSTAGGTALELCGAGVPSVLLAVAANQEPGLRALLAAGAATSAPLDADAVVALLSRLRRSPRRREHLASAGRELVDGLGASRTVSHLRAALVTTRPAGRGDARRVWEWANDPEVRARSFSSEPIPWDTHRAWFERMLSDPSRLLVLARVEDGPYLGYVRYDIAAGPHAEVGIALVDRFRGKGWGAAMLLAAEERLGALSSRVAELHALIKPGNVASQKVFRIAGYELAGSGSDARGEWLRYIRHRHGADG